MRAAVPGLPLLIPAAVLVFAALVARLVRHGRATVPRVVLLVAVCAYGIGLLRSVLLPAEVVVGAARAALPPWWVFVQPVPLATVPDDPSGMLLNIVLFVPLGVLLPVLLRRPTAGRVVLAGFLVSLGIELVQLVTGLTVLEPRIADVDDLIGNTAGTAIGLALLRLAVLAPPLRRLAAAVRVHGSGTSGPGPS